MSYEREENIDEEVEDYENGTYSEWLEFELADGRGNRYGFGNYRRESIIGVEEYYEEYDGKMIKNLSVTRITLKSGVSRLVLMPYEKVMELV